MGTPYVMTKSGQKRGYAAEHRTRCRPRRQDRAGTRSLGADRSEMPEMDGFTLTRKIKTETAFQSIPVVIHSSLSGSANEDHVRRVGATATSPKFEANELAQGHRFCAGLSPEALAACNAPPGLCSLATLVIAAKRVDDDHGAIEHAVVVEEGVEVRLLIPEHVHPI